MAFQAFCIAVKNTDDVANYDFKNILLPSLSAYDVCLETIMNSPVAAALQKAHVTFFRNIIEELDIDQLEQTIVKSRMTQDTIELLKRHERKFMDHIKETKFYEDFVASLHNKSYNIKKIILLIHKTHSDPLIN